MKKINLAFLILLIGLAGFAQPNNIIGKWYGNDEMNDAGSFEFKPDNTVIMYQNGEPMPFRFKFDSKKNPNWIDFIISHEDVTLTLYGLVKFIDKDTINLELFREQTGQHPTQFTNESNELTTTAIILKRQVLH